MEQNTASIVDELAGASGGEGGEVKTDLPFRESARILAAKVLETPRRFRFMMTGASLEQPFLEEMLGRTAGFCAVHVRMYPLARIVAAPREMTQVLDICADLVRGAVRNGGGNVLVFLPGMEEIQRLRPMLPKVMQIRKQETGLYQSGDYFTKD